MKDNARYFSAIRNGTSKIVAEFIQSCRPKIYALAAKFPMLDRDDIFQEAMLVILKKIKEGSLKEEQMTASLSTYLYSVAQNSCRDKIKKKHPEQLQENYDAPASDNEDEELYYERLQHVKSLAEMVKPPCNGMITDYYIYDIPYKEIAAKYGYKNENVAKKKNSECMQKARKLVAENKSLKKIFYNYAQ